MVSTRQMATSSSGCANASGSNHAFESTAARLNIVTRSSNYTLANYAVATLAPGPAQRSFTQGGAGGAGVAAEPSTSTMITRHHHSNAARSMISTPVDGTDAAGGGRDANATSLNLLDLPIEILTLIFSFVGYHKVGQIRVVSRKMNDDCMHILNSTFSKLITQTFNRFQAIKANMPRRESARRNHPLACECDIIETCNMRLSLLQMTFGKRIERGHCCFFPGAILDEVYTILNYIRNTPRLERPYRVTDELFDLSTMAMEHFRDRIEPTLPDMAYFNKDFFELPTTTTRPPLVIDHDDAESTSNLTSPPQSNMVLRKGIRKIKQGMKIYNNQLSVLRIELRTCRRKSLEQGKQIAEQQKLLAEQQKQTHEYANRLDENDKKNEEMARKFSTLLQELNKCKTELQYWRSKSPAIPTCTSCGQKMAPFLPPEDYQALINQGVKPEDIILNLNDDTDVESDASTSAEFVSPDETTTAKLLAVNTATKNRKRQHSSATTSNTNTSNGSGSTSNNAGGGGSGSAFTQHFAAGHVATDFMSMCRAGNNGCQQMSPSEMTSSLDHARVANIITCTTATNATPQISNQGRGDFDSTSPIFDPFVATSGTTAGTGGYSTTLFYGTNVHKGVIVSPSMLAQKLADETAPNVGDGFAVDATNTMAAAAVADDVIISHDTKKARRVQKATRCLNGSGKRSK